MSGSQPTAIVFGTIGRSPKTQKPDSTGGWKVTSYMEQNPGGWAIAQSPILVTTITLSRRRRKGYVSYLAIGGLSGTPRHLVLAGLSAQIFIIC